MSARRTTILLAELADSFRMAMSAIAAHKLRSALTLLGVLVGVFSIIVVMTAMRVMQSDIEAQISELGSQTFMIQKYPIIFFTRPEGMEKIWRRKNITLQHGYKLQERLTLARAVGIDTGFWGGEVNTRYKKSAPDVQLFGETPGCFPARNCFSLWATRRPTRPFSAPIGLNFSSLRMVRRFRRISASSSIIRILFIKLS